MVIDFLMVLLGIVFFAVSALYILACERLR